MADVAKNRHVHGGAPAGSDLRTLVLVVKTRGTVAFAFAYACVLCFVFFTLLFAFNPNVNPSSPWFAAILASGANSPAGDGSQFTVRSTPAFENVENPDKDSVFNRNRVNPDASDWNVADPFAPAGQKQTESSPAPAPAPESTVPSDWIVSGPFSPAGQKQTEPSPAPEPAPESTVASDWNVAGPFSPATQKQTESSPAPESTFDSDWNVAGPFAPAAQNQTDSSPAPAPAQESTVASNWNVAGPFAPAVQKQTKISLAPAPTKSTVNGPFSPPLAQTFVPTMSEQRGTMNGTEKTNESVSGSLNSTDSTAPAKKQSSVSDSGSVESLLGCDLFDGDWVVDDSYPLYEPDSCPLIDEQFSCISNGRPDMDYLKHKWKPNGCSLPRLDAKRLLQMLKHKRLVFVGDSLNRNMWESMVCILSSAVKDKSKVFEAHGRHHFRAEAEYSFVFKDYNFTVEFYASPFLVQEREIKDNDGKSKERLRLDLMGKTCKDYKGADILIFNTGHWWTHEKTSLGKDYYQEGNRVYDQLNALEAFRRALKTWARWIDANVDPNKSIVLFRGFSTAHFRGGQWNSGGACDNETEPIKNHNYLMPYPPKMIVLEKVLKRMKTNVRYLNITRMTDYRKDGHPSIYRKKNIPDEAKISPKGYQDCSHWCLPGVPDSWNELLYAELLIREYQTTTSITTTQKPNC